MQITFDQDIQPGTLNVTNWLASAEGVQWTFANVQALGDKVVAVNAAGGIANPQNLANYFGIVPDVVGLDGAPAEPFIAFPMTIGP